MAATEATREFVWLRRILEDLQEKQFKATPLMINNTSAIKLARNIVFRPNKANRYQVQKYLIQHQVKTGKVNHCPIA